jgi:MFS family permease
MFAMSRFAAAVQPACRSSLATVLAGFGLLVDLYDFSVINLAKPLLEKEHGTMTDLEKGCLTSAALFGAVVGQLVFGALADVLGRRVMFIATALIVLFASIASALVVSGNPAWLGGASIYAQLTVWRLLLGFGVGGEYPLAAAHTAEARGSTAELARVATDGDAVRDVAAAHAPSATALTEQYDVLMGSAASHRQGGVAPRDRVASRCSCLARSWCRCERSSGRSLASVYAMMGVGKLLAPLVVLAIQLCGAGPGATWRLAFAFGGALSTLSVALRCGLLAESAHFAALQIERAEATEAAAEAANVQSEAAEAAGAGGPTRPMGCAARCATFRGVTSTLGVLWRPLLGTAGCWFLYDIVDFGVGLYSAELFDSSSDLETTLNVLYLALLNFPGFLLAIWTVSFLYRYILRESCSQFDSLPLTSRQVTSLGRKGGFNAGLVGMIACFGLLAFFELRSGGGLAAEQLGAFPILLFGAMAACDAFGPGCGCYVIPAEVFPTSARATAHGIASASGKLGAVVGTMTFPLIVAAAGRGGVFIASAAVCLFAIGWSVCFVPTYGDGKLRALARDDAAVRRAQRYRRGLRRGGGASKRAAHCEGAPAGSAEEGASAAPAGPGDGALSHEERVDFLYGIGSGASIGRRGLHTLGYPLDAALPPLRRRR